MDLEEVLVDGGLQMVKKCTKTKKRGKIKKVMSEYKSGKLHSGSKKGPVVKSKKQALAIAISESKKKKRKR